jgi:hypothetical protein
MNRQRVIEYKVYKKRKRWKTWKLNRNFENNQRKKEKPARNRKGRKPIKQIDVPSDFSMQGNRDGVLKFINTLKLIPKGKYRFILLNFQKVIDISHGAITILLSTIGWLKDNKIPVAGNYPNNVYAKKQFQASGFLEFFKTLGRRDYERGKNTIVARGETKSNSELTAKLIRESTETIWGFNDKNKKVQGMLIELMANTVNHAYIDKAQKGWYFALDHLTDLQKVKFCFVDNGSGILSTLERKLPEKVLSALGGKSSETLKRAYLGDFGSRTKLSNRGRGLKAIKKVAETGYIKSLKVITNDKLYDFETNNIEQLPEKFDGTFYFWEIDKTCQR